MLPETLSSLSRYLRARLEVGQPMVELSRHNAQVVLQIIGHLQEQQGLVDDAKAFLVASKRRQSRVSGLAASVLEEIPEKLALPRWAISETLES